MSIQIKILSILTAFFILFGVIFVFYTNATKANDIAMRVESIGRLVEFEAEKINGFKGSKIEDLLPSLKDEIDLFVNGAEQSDDITMLALYLK